MSFHMRSFAEDQLSDGQHVIKTANLVEFGLFSSYLANLNPGFGRMGVVTGGPGTGKTTAIQAFLHTAELNSHTGLPSMTKIKVMPRATMKAIALALVAALKDTVRGRTSYELADESADALIRNDIRILFVDEADRLTEETFDFLRHIFDATGCSLVVVGLDPILRVIDCQEKFASRVALRMRFEVPTREEYETVILPQMQVPYWEFDPARTEDLEMADFLWSFSKGSLRKLRIVLELSSEVARADKERQISRIILNDIREACQVNASEKDRKLLQSPKIAHAPGSYEDISERRNESKKQKKHKNG